jgi:hypothetical protein
VNARESSSASGSTPLLPDEYDSLIEKLRESANAIIPRNATVLVVSRGDDELLRIGPRRALHFPQDEFGRYAGYHPEDSDAAIAALEDMRARGAEYLLLPSTSFWWLDYYEGLRDHLERNYPAQISADDCMIFELATTDIQTAESDADSSRVSAATSSQRLAGPLDELLRALLPDDARIAVVAGGDGDLPSFGRCTAVQPRDGGLPGLLVQANTAGAEFLVIPAIASDHVYAGREPGTALGGWRLVTHQRYLADIYEREAQTAPEPEPERAAHSSGSADAGRRPGGGEPRTASRGLWQRIRRWFRND